MIQIGQISLEATENGMLKLVKDHEHQKTFLSISREHRKFETELNLEATVETNQIKTSKRCWPKTAGAEMGTENSPGTVCVLQQGY